MKLVLVIPYYKKVSPSKFITLRDNASSYRTVKEWCAAFKQGRSSTKDDHPPGRQCEIATQQTVDAVLDTVIQDRRMTVRQIANTHEISKSTVERILQDRIYTNKVSAR